MLQCRRKVKLDALSIYYDIGAGLWRNSAVTTNFKLADLPNYTEFTALFDAYQINAVKISIVPLFNSGDPGQVSNSGNNYYSIPHLASVVDIDGAVSPPGDQATLLQYNNCKLRRLTKPTTIYIKNPRVADAEYQNGVLSGYGEGQKKKWIDCSSPSVQHYGARWWMDTLNSTGYGLDKRFQADVYVTYYVKFKRVI